MKAAVTLPALAGTAAALLKAGGSFRYASGTSLAGDGMTPSALAAGTVGLAAGGGVAAAAGGAVGGCAGADVAGVLARPPPHADSSELAATVAAPPSPRRS